MVEEKKKRKPGGLLALPAELRNHIFELAFTDSSSSSIRINLLAAQPPKKDLLLTCRQTFSDAAGLYKIAYRNYWTRNTFLLQMPNHFKPTEIRETRLEIEALNSADLDHITSLIMHSWGFQTYTCYRLIGGGMGWKWEDYNDQYISFLRVRCNLEIQPSLDFVFDNYSTLKELEEGTQGYRLPNPTMKEQLVAFLETG